MQHHVAVPREFFEKSKNDYRNWRFAFFREIIQNAIDAGATSISFMVEETDEGCRITVQDNGHGMSRDILMNKFMCLRATTKGGAGSVGGFGVAKEIIAFCHDSFRIETQGVVVNGSGGAYDECEAETADGVKIVVNMNDAYGYIMERELKNWCSLSNVSATITLNGEALPGSSLKLSHSMSAPFGTIRFKDDSDSEAHYSTLIVKMNGMAMFSREMYTSGGCFVAELNLQGTSVELLTSNRDGLSGNLENTLSDILNQLANNRSKLKLSDPITFEFNNNLSAYGETTIPANAEYLHEIAQQRAASSLFSGDEVKALAESVSDIKEFREMREELADTLSRTMLKKEYASHDTALSKIEKAIGSVDEAKLPENWVIRVGANDRDDSPHRLIKRLNLKRYVRIAHTWRLLVNYILTTSPVIGGRVDRNGNVYVSGKLVKCGFVLDDVSAICITDNDDEYQILINPFKNEEDYAEDFVTLVEVACHECAHLVEESHGEYYVNQLHYFLKELRRAVRNDRGLRGHGINRLENMISDELKFLI